ncbi:hypothetical protein JCM10212_000516 [Sporobolomyces blumeae]
MADDFVLNFDSAPTGASTSGPRQARTKGGRWTDRAKEKRLAKRGPAKLNKPSTTTDGRANAAREPGQDGPSAREGGAGPTKVRSKVPGSRQRDSTATTTGGGAGQNAGGGHQQSGGGRRLEQAVGPSGKKQFISSLFTADGLPVPSASTDSTAPVVAARPSNAPLTAATRNDDDVDGEDDETMQEPDPAPELSKLGLMRELVAALATKLGITGPTACQAGAVPRLVEPSSSSSSSASSNSRSRAKGKRPDTASTHELEFAHDAILRAQTGSGKTLTFLLPMLQDLLTLSPELLASSAPSSSSTSTSTSTNPDRTIGTLAVILAPTRELASQIHTVLSSLLSALPHSKAYSISPRSLTACLLVGGANRTHEKRRLRKGCPIVVATPGRLLDHLKTTESFRLAGEGPRQKLNQAPRGRDNANNAPLGARRGGATASGGPAGGQEKLGLRWLIVDECDRLMDLGFEEQMRGILEDLEKRSPSSTVDSAGGGAAGTLTTTARLAKRRRTILCSATASEGVDRLAGLIMGEEGETPPIVGAREDVKVREPVRRDLTGISASGDPDKGKKRAAEDDADEDDDEDDDAKQDDSNGPGDAPRSALQLPSGFTPPSQLLHHYLVVPPKLRFVSLIALLRKLLVKPRANKGSSSSAPSSPGMKILVFMSCTDAVDFWWKAIGGMKMGSRDDGANDDSDAKTEAQLEQDEQDERRTAGGDKQQKKKSLASLHPLLPAIPVYRLHGSLPLQTRLSSLSAFSGKYEVEDGKRKGQETDDAVLLCTSVAARGLDVKNVGCVVQVDAPTEGGITEYVHRVGRTARAGAQGSAYSFLLPSETPYAQLLEDGINSAESNDKNHDKATTQNKKKTRLREVGVEEVLRQGYGGDGREYETRATDVQMGFERWANATEDNAALARKAFQAHIRAYATHPSSEKHIFNTKALHLGHLAKSFGMREAPGHAGGSGGGKGGGKKGAKRARTDASDDGARGGGGGGGGGEFETGRRKKAMNSEERMKMLMRGPKGNGGGEFQIAGEDVLGALRKGK